MASRSRKSPPPPKRTFGEWLKETRNACNPKVSQSGIAHALEVDVSTVSRWERSIATPDVDQLRVILAMLNASADKVLASTVAAPKKARKAA